MTAPTRTCTSCETAIPEGAMFCPIYGEATPTEISQDTGIGSVVGIDVNEAQHRTRLQRTLGDGYELRELIGRGMRSRTLAGQRAEVQLACRVLNTMTGLGMPDSYRVE